MKIVPFSNIKNINNFGDILPVVIISLKDQSERRKALSKNKIPISWINNFFCASDLRSANKQEVEKIADLDKLKKFYGYECTSSEIGCALSHKKVCEWLANSPYELMLVLEDDIVPIMKNYEQEIKEIATKVYSLTQKKLSFIVHLGLKPHQVTKTLKRKVISLSNLKAQNKSTLFLDCENGDHIWYAHAYLISKSAAINTIKLEKKILLLADDWGGKKKMGIIDKIFYCQPPIFAQNEDIESTIGIRESGQNNNDSQIQTSSFTLRAYESFKKGLFLSKILKRIKSKFPFIIN